MWLLPITLFACDPMGAGKAGDTASDATGYDPAEEDPAGTAEDPAGTEDESLTCPAPPACLTLAEAMDRGQATVELGTSRGSGLRIESATQTNLCLEEWYIFLSSGSQDALGGSDQPHTLAADDGLGLDYGSFSFEAEENNTWYCIEHNQYTDDGESYTYNGALAPEVLTDLVLNPSDVDGDGEEDHEDWGEDGTVTQEEIWSFIALNPVVIVGRSANWLQVAPGSEGEVAIEVTNLGRAAAMAMVTETVPVGFTVTSTSQIASTFVLNTNGTTTLVFPVKLDAAVDSSDTSSPAIYDTERIAYTVAADAGCRGRVDGQGIVAEWRDGSGATRYSYGEALAVDCCVAAAAEPL